VAERFTAMYVTERTRDMGSEGREALSRLFSQSAMHGAKVPVDVVSLA
jgi:predicted solute-binding protein